MMKFEIPKKGEGERFEQLLIDGARCMREVFGMPIAVVEFIGSEESVTVRREWIERDENGGICFNHHLRRRGAIYVTNTRMRPTEAKVVAIVREPQDRVKCYGLDWRRREFELFPIQRDAAHWFERRHRHGPLYYDRGVLIDSEIHPHVLEES